MHETLTFLRFSLVFDTNLNNLRKILSITANYQLLSLMLLKKSNEQLLVGVDHSQLRTIASETVDPID